MRKASIKVDDFDTLFAENDRDTFGHDVRKFVVTEKEIPVAELHDFPGHPFPVHDDEELENLTQSIREHGVIHSLVVRKTGNGYEIISGHRRCRAAEKAGLAMVPVKVVEMSDDEATACMVEANFRQRENIPVSVKAKAYRMEYDALKHQGKNTGIWSLSQMGEAAGESEKTVQRYVRLSYLIDELLEYEDNGKLGIVQGVSLSYLNEDCQFTVLVALQQTKTKMTAEQAEKLKSLGQNGKLMVEQAILVLSSVKARPERLAFDEGKIRSYFPEGYSSSEIQKVIFRLLDEWKAGKQ